MGEENEEEQEKKRRRWGKCREGGKGKREEKRKRRKKERMRKGRKRGEEGPAVSWSEILTYSAPKEFLQHTVLITFPNDGIPYEDHWLYLNNVGGGEMGNGLSWEFLRVEGNYTFRKNNCFGHNYVN